LRYVFAIGAALVGFLVSPALAIIAVTSTATSTTDGVRAQAVITNPTGRGGPDSDPVQAVSIIQMNCAILIRDGNISNGIMLVKHNLTPAQAWGSDQPFGHDGPPTTNPDGPWNGLVWPYRDQYDYFPQPGQPLGNDVGIPFSSDPGVYGFVNVNGIARGGPTDPSGGSSDPGMLTRGVTGNGLTGPATYFDFDIVPLSGDPNRSVTMTIFAASAVVVVQDTVTGTYSNMSVPVGDFTTTIALPEPTALSILGIAGLALLRRSRVRRDRI